MALNFREPPEGLFVYRTRCHFDDFDALWVMHHTRYLIYLERAQQAMFDALMETDRFDPEAYPDLYVVVRKIEIDYLQPIKDVGPFLVALRVQRLREAGLTLAFSVRDPSGQTTYARGTRTVCHLSGKTHQPAGFSPAFREVYGRWEAAGRALAGEGMKT